MTALLDIDQISLSFGGLAAVAGFDLHLESGDLHGLIGPNGAGKTTVFNLITGVYQPDCGEARLAGKKLTGSKPHQIAAAGIARTFQNIRLFPDLSVLDNVRVACHVCTRHSLRHALLRTPSHLGEERAVVERSRTLLGLFGLERRERELARNLSYGDQRRLEIVRALATEPKVLLLDEPAAGMNATEKRVLAQLVRDIREQFKLTILLIEHDMGLVMDLCHRITVLDHGQIIAVGTPSEVQNNPKVIEAYLGEPQMANPLLEIRDLDVRYGAIQALHGVSFSVQPGQIVALLSANGAGKSTTLRTISGLLTPARGQVLFDGKPIRGLPPHEIVQRGISHVPEGRGIFANLSVEENLRLGAYSRSKASQRSEIAGDHDWVLGLFPRLSERLTQSAGTLSGGEQQMLAIGRALMARPRLLLLDEPSLGLAPQLVQRIFQTIREINKQGMTILLVEQNAHMALACAHFGYVLEVGRVVMSDAAEKLASTDAVKKAYLGEAAQDTDGSQGNPPPDGVH